MINSVQTKFYIRLNQFIKSLAVLFSKLTRYLIKKLPTLSLEHKFPSCKGLSFMQMFRLTISHHQAVYKNTNRLYVVLSFELQGGSNMTGTE